MPMAKKMSAMFDRNVVNVAKYIFESVNKNKCILSNMNKKY